MAGKVIHVSDELHTKIKEHCEEIGVSAAQWARQVLEKAISNGVLVSPTNLKPEDTTPVEKKKLPISPQPNKDLDEVWYRPAFWEECD